MKKITIDNTLSLIVPLYAIWWLLNGFFWGSVDGLVLFFVAVLIYILVRIMLNQYRR